MTTRLRRRQKHTGGSSDVADANAGPDTDTEPDAAVTARIIEQTRSVTMRLRQAHLQQTGTKAPGSSSDG
ncbi:hypothetical protein DL769_007296 [Monosporascus sp. CRB-8-3]|nr:hypothetical protein DL769_007296 [Monosporascus sp. CRB-8-3]